MTIYCPFCGAEFDLEKDLWGRMAECGGCGRKFVIGQTPNPGTIGIPRLSMTINEAMKAAHGCKQMGDFVTARRMAAETLKEHPNWIKGHYFLALADILLHEYDDAAKSLFTFIERMVLAIRDALGSDYVNTINNELSILTTFQWGRELRIGNSFFAENHFYDMLRGNNPLMQQLVECVPVLFENSEAFVALGHCYIQRHPDLFSRYPDLFGKTIEDYEAQILNNPPKSPAEYPAGLEYIPSITGLAYALANIERHPTDADVLKVSRLRYIKDFILLPGL